MTATGVASTTMGETSARRPARRRRIIERPRLLRALDRSQARVRTLVAAAGYGKTILAEQWSAQDDRRSAWFRARRSSIDVAVLARGLSAAAAEIVPGAGRRLEERLAATQDPAREAGVLAEILAGDLLDWPDDAWIVLDDYHHVATSTSGEHFVDTLVHRAPVRMLIASRARPSWVAGRHILYGEVLEITQTALAMSVDEVEEVLAGRHAELTPGLLAIADGWPAVIGLASVAEAAPAPDVDVPEALYEFFADEVYRALDLPVRTGLAILGALPLVDRELAAEFLGESRAEAVSAEALALGILDERDGRLELHPLAATFLEARARRDAGTELDLVAPVALAAYRRRREWDAAFDVVDRFGLDDELEPLVADALDELLNAGRLTTLENWLDRSAKRSNESPILLIARAEVWLRTGRHVTAQTFAEAVADMDSPLARDFEARALVVAGRAAHIGSREETALQFFRSAEAVAPDGRWLRAALWGQLMSAAALELDLAHELMSLLAADSPRHDPTEIIRLVDKRLALGFRFGAIEHLTEARRVAELAEEVDDPFVRCSFLCTYSCALNLAAHYQDGLDQAEALLEDATEHRVDFALAYGHLMRAAALAGLRRFESTHDALDVALANAKKCNDEFGVQAGYAARVRLLLQQGLAAEACGLEPPELDGALPGMRGEVFASRALALACIGRIDDARSLASRARAESRAIETRVLVPAVEAVCAASARRDDLLDQVRALLDIGHSAGAVDLVVTTYRSAPELLVALLSNKETVERTVFLLTRAGDHDLAKSVGFEPARSLDPVSGLSSREREVYALLCEGLSNAEIGRRLFIAESTVKVHVHHVFDKLGVRSRTALALSHARRPRPES
jgi:ATP/maltotriose-dependent transcriptional regulator MalT